MPLVQWPHINGRPVVEVRLDLENAEEETTRRLLADTGAGSLQAGFELILKEEDCLLCEGIPSHSVTLEGAYHGSFPVYVIRIEIPALNYDQYIRAVGVSSPLPGLDGIACFRFLNNFTYGNFGDRNQFGLEL